MQSLTDLVTGPGLTKFKASKSGKYIIHTPYQPKWKFKKVISGGQNGAQRAALESAKRSKICTGGTCCINGQTTTSAQEWVLTLDFELLPLNAECKIENLPFKEQLIITSQLNIDAADGTLIFWFQDDLKACDLPMAYCHNRSWTPLPKELLGTSTQHKPYLAIIDISPKFRESNVKMIVDFIKSNRIEVLNVAGHWDEYKAGTMAFSYSIECLLDLVFRQLK